MLTLNIYHAYVNYYSHYVTNRSAFLYVIDQ
jgi:hypothetical protein